MISHHQRYIFFHINKTGGTSVEHALGYTKGTANSWKGKHHKLKWYKRVANKHHGFENYFKFTVVRNPWDRFLSLYKYRVKRNHPSFDGKIIPFKAWAKKIYNCKPRFCKGFTQKDPKMFVKPQLNWITDASGNMVVDFICRFENFQQDFNTVCNKIGIPERNLPHKNKSKHKHYTEYYNDETIEIVAKKYKKDIEYFGYKFGG